MALADTVKGGLYMGYSVILFRQLSRHLFRHKDSVYSDINKKEDKSFDLSSVVAEAGLEPTTSGL